MTGSSENAPHTDSAPDAAAALDPMSALMTPASAASIMLEKATSGSLRPAAVGCKEWWPSHEQMSEYELNVGLYWQLTRVYLQFETNERGWKRVSEESDKRVKDMCTVPEGDFKYEEILKAIVGWDVYLRVYTMRHAADEEERLRCALAIRLWCEHGWNYLSAGLKRLVVSVMPASMLPDRVSATGASKASE